MYNMRYHLDHYKKSLQIYYKYLEYTRISREISNLFEVFADKPCYSLECATVNSEWIPFRGVPKLLQIFAHMQEFVYFYTKKSAVAPSL